jgi:hypothetical protein
MASTPSSNRSRTPDEWIALWYGLISPRCIADDIGWSLRRMHKRAAELGYFETTEDWQERQEQMEEDRRKREASDVGYPL